MGINGKKGKRKSGGSVGASADGKSHYGFAVEMAESEWRSGDPVRALNMIMGLISRFPRYEPAYRLMLRILVEERYHPRDIIQCLRRIEKIGYLRPEEKMIYGMQEFELSHYKKALPLLEKARELPPHLIEEWVMNRG